MASLPAQMGVLQIEPTDHCNLACRMCAPHAERWPEVHGVPKGFMDPALYARILDNLVADDCRFDHLILQWLGDPALHPELEGLLALAGRRLAGRVGYLRFDTNALQLTPARVTRLFAERAPDVPIVAVFTIDAATPDTYRATKGRDALDVAQRHVRRFLAERRRLGAANVSVQVQFVVQPTNWFEAGAFLAYWEDAVACVGGGVGFTEVMFKRLSVGGGAAGQAAADRLYEDARAAFGLAPRDDGPVAVRVWEDRPWQRDDAHAARGPCPGAWLTPVVRHDGHLLLCCADLAGTLDLGSLADQGFRELWEGEAATRLRLDHLAGHFPGACAACGGINWYSLPAGAGEATRARGRALGLVAA